MCVRVCDVHAPSPSLVGLFATTGLSSSLLGIFQAGILEWVDMCPTGDPPNPGTEPMSLKSPELEVRFFTI